MDNLQSSAQKQLRQHVEKVERLLEEIAALRSDIKDELIVAKGNGFLPLIIRKLLSLRKKSKSEREEEEAILDVYKHALGMLEGTPLGTYAERQLEAAPQMAGFMKGRKTKAEDADVAPPA